MDGQKRPLCTDRHLNLKGRQAFLPENFARPSLILPLFSTGLRKEVKSRQSQRQVAASGAGRASILEFWSYINVAEKNPHVLQVVVLVGDVPLDFPHVNSLSPAAVEDRLANHGKSIFNRS